MRKPLAIAGALAALLPSAAMAQMKIIEPAEVADVARARALDLRITEISPATPGPPLVRGMIVSREVAPDARIGIGLSSLYAEERPR
ncbi:MAG TPA: hypothetical protein VIL42_09405 [Sphingomicrobium sp.]|jgi:hypothetical protein